MTPKEILLASKGWGDMEAEKRKFQTLLARSISYQIYCSIPMKTRHKNIDQYWPMEDKKPIPSKEEREKTYKAAKWLK